MGLTVSRKTAKNLAVRRKNEIIFTISRKRMSTVKKSNHKILPRGVSAMKKSCSPGCCYRL